VIVFEHLTYRYPDASLPVLDNLSLHVDEGEFILVTGPSGAGKSTLLRAINGLVPHLSGGTIGGVVRVGDLDPIGVGPRRMAEMVGFVFQDPEAQAVVDVVEDELAFAMENLGLPVEVMRVRVEEALDQLDIAPLRSRALSSLSGGERQRVALASVLTLQPRVLVLDEPTSQLDPQSAEDVLQALVRLNHDLGLTVVLSEHRLERVVQYADRLLYLPEPGAQPLFGPPREIMGEIGLVPPVVELGKRLGWKPLPLTVKEARAFVRGLPLQDKGKQERGSLQARPADLGTRTPALEIRGLHFAYDGSSVLHGIDLTVQQGEFVALMGRNGAGKTTLLKQCIGLLHPSSGRIRVLGEDTQDTPVEQLARRVGYVPQNPNALLFADTIADELAFTRRVQGLPADENRALLETLGLYAMRDRYPRDLSVGERQRVAMAAVLVSDPDLILLDEPTRGLDYEQKQALTTFLQTLNQVGKTVFIVTHDVELVTHCAQRVVLMGEGRVVADGPTREVMHDSPILSSQINRLFRDPRFLTVDDVVTAL
jgi:energy-coupling factor transporter ATP-binding protein EcfA2